MSNDYFQLIVKNSGYTVTYINVVSWRISRSPDLVLHLWTSDGLFADLPLHKNFIIKPSYMYENN